MENQNKPIQMLSVYNTTDEDFSFQWDSATYSIKAGEKKEFVDYISEHCAKKLADKYAKTANKDEKKVLQQAFLQNVPVNEMAEKMGIDLAKIRQEVITKEKEKARVINLEAEVMAMREQMKALLAQKETKTEIKEDVKEEKLDKRSKEYRALKAQEAEQAQENK